MERIIASSCRQKILLALYENNKKTHVTNLVRIINGTYNEVNRNVQILEKEGIVKTKYVGNMRMIELEVENSKTQALLKALHILHRSLSNSEK